MKGYVRMEEISINRRLKHYPRVYFPPLEITARGAHVVDLAVLRVYPYTVPCRIVNPHTRFIRKTYSTVHTFL